jgi:uncharacterized protein YjbI with pentapeptide repeats
MKQYLGLFLLAGWLVSAAWSAPALPDLAGAQGRAISLFNEDSAYRLRLEGDKYVCRNWRGDIGLNDIPLNELLRSKQGECGNFREADLRGAELRGAVLKGAKLNGADLSQADLSGADLTAARIIDVKFYEANLAGAVLHRAPAYRAWFRRAELGGAVLTGMDLRLASFVHANLRGANLLDSWVDGADFSKSVYNRKTLLPFGPDEAALRGMIRAE